jgi:hypothetical protein
VKRTATTGLLTPSADSFEREGARSARAGVLA